MTGFFVMMAIMVSSTAVGMAVFMRSPANPQGSSDRLYRIAVVVLVGAFAFGLLTFLNGYFKFLPFLR